MNRQMMNITILVFGASFGLSAYASTSLAELEAKRSVAFIDGQEADESTSRCFYFAKAESDGEKSLLVTNSSSNDVQETIGVVFRLGQATDLDGKLNPSASYANGILTYDEEHEGLKPGQTVSSHLEISVSADLKSVLWAKVKTTNSSFMGLRRRVTTLDCQF